MAHYGRFRVLNARTTGTKQLSDNFDCDKARFVFLQANSGQINVEVRRGPLDADAGALVGSMQLRTSGDTVILAKHPTDVLVYGSASAVKVGRVGP